MLKCITHSFHSTSQRESQINFSCLQGSASEIFSLRQSQDDHNRVRCCGQEKIELNSLVCVRVSMTCYYIKQVRIVIRWSMIFFPPLQSHFKIYEKFCKKYSIETSTCNCKLCTLGSASVSHLQNTPNKMHLPKKMGVQLILKI